MRIAAGQTQSKLWVSRYAREYSTLLYLRSLEDGFRQRRMHTPKRRHDTLSSGCARYLPCTILHTPPASTMGTALTVPTKQHYVCIYCTGWGGGGVGATHPVVLRTVQYAMLSLASLVRPNQTGRVPETTCDLTQTMPQYHSLALASLFRSVVSLVLLFQAALHSPRLPPPPLASLQPHYSTSERGHYALKCFRFLQDHPVSIAPAWDGASVARHASPLAMAHVAVGNGPRTGQGCDALTR